jgi:carboxypeptidase D
VAAATAFLKTGDFVRGHNLAILGSLIDSGVKVALMYGDRDYQCNCEATGIDSGPYKRTSG